MFFFETSLTFEVIITLFFWVVLYEPGDPTITTWDYPDHIVPIVILSADYCMNRIPFNMRHLPVTLSIMLVYGIVNMTYTLVTGTPVYPPLNFHDVLSFVWLIVLVILQCLVFLGLTRLT